MKKLIALLIFALASICHGQIVGTANQTVFTCTGTTGPYPFTWPAYDTGGIEVFETQLSTGQIIPLNINTDYTITPVNLSYINGGSVATTQICSAGDSLTILRDTEQTQLNVFTEYMPSLYQTIQSTVDKLTMEIQDQSATPRVTSIIPGTNVTCSPNVYGSCTGAVTINSSGGGGGGGNNSPNPYITFTNQMLITMPYSSYGFSNPGIIGSCSDSSGVVMAVRTFLTTVGPSQYNLNFLLAAPSSGSCTAVYNASSGATGVYLPIAGGTLLGPISGPTINSIQNEEDFAGATLNLRVAAAIAALPGNCGTVLIPTLQTIPTFNTPIVKPRCVTLEGAGTAGPSNAGLNPMIQFTGTGMTEAIVIADNGYTAGTSLFPIGGIKNLTILGPTLGPSVPNNTAGIHCGGDDPAGLFPRTSSTVDPYFGSYQTIENVQVLGFGYGFLGGDNCFNTTMQNDSMLQSYVGFGSVTNPIDSGENMVILSGIAAENTYAFASIPYSWTLISTSLDFNGGASNTFPDIYNSSIRAFSGHWERQNGPYVQLSSGSGFIYLDDTEVQYDSSTSGTDDYMFLVHGATYITLRDVGVFSNHVVTNLISSDIAEIAVENLRGNANRSDGTVNPATGVQSIFNIGSYTGIDASIRQSQTAFGANSIYTPTQWNNDLIYQPTTFNTRTVLTNNVGSSGGAAGPMIDLFDGTASAATPHKFLNVASGNFGIVSSAGNSTILGLTDAGVLSWGVGAGISSSSHVVQSTSSAPTGSCSPNGYIPVTINGVTLHLATCP